MKFWNSLYFRWILIALLLILVLLDVFDRELFSSGDLDTPFFAALGGWVGSMMTAFAVIIAAEGLRSDKLKEERRLLEEQKAEVRRVEDEQQKRHVEIRDDVGRVFTWFSPLRDQITGSVTDVQLILVNQTDLPIYNWRVIAESDPLSQWGPTLFGPLIPGDTKLTLGVSPQSFSVGDNMFPRAKIEFEATNGEYLCRGYSGSLTPIDAF